MSAILPARERSTAGWWLLSVGAALTLLLLEWLVLSGAGFSLGQGEVARTLPGLALFALCAGSGGAVAAWLLQSRLDARAVAVAAPLAAIWLLDLYFALGAGVHPVTKFLGTACFALVTFALVVQLLRRAPGCLQRAGCWWAVAALLAILTLLVTVLQAADSMGKVTAAVSGLLAAGLLVLWLRSDSNGSGLPVLAVITVLAAAVWLGVRVPVLEPLNGFASGKPSVLLVTIDTLRADHVGAYGYGNANTPNLDALAQQGVRFSQAVTVNAYTGPSHASILTGLYPESHGVLINHSRLVQAVPTLADMLRDEGYVTGAFVSGFTTQDSACGLPSRFQYQDDDIRPFRWFPAVAGRIGAVELMQRAVKAGGWYRGDFLQSYRVGEDTADIAVQWLQQNGQRPFFVWTHFFDPHLPYRPPQTYRRQPDPRQSVDWYAMNSDERGEIVSRAEDIAAMIALYDSEIAYADAQLGRVIEAARAAAPGGRLLIVVTSDHGESMGEHNVYWFRDLHDPTLLVPMIIVPPDAADLAGRVVDAQVRTLDLTPTMLDLLDIDAAPEFDGSSLATLMNGSDTAGTGPAYSGLYPIPKKFDRVLHAVRAEGWKLIELEPGWMGGGAAAYQPLSYELYHVVADSAELVNRIDTAPEQRASLESLLNSQKHAPVTPEVELSDEDLEKLRSLGYIH